MLSKIQYKDETEKEQILVENQDKFLIEEQNLFDGNFLIFSDEPLPERVVYTNVPKEEIDSLKTEIKTVRGAVDFIIMNY